MNEMSVMGIMKSIVPFGMMRLFIRRQNGEFVAG